MRADDRDAAQGGARKGVADAESTGDHGQIRPAGEHQPNRAPIPRHERALEDGEPGKGLGRSVRGGQLLLVGGHRGAQAGLETGVDAPGLGSRGDR